MTQSPSNERVAVFGGGCFWCTEAVFKMLRGVSHVEPGYAGGTRPNPTYEFVSSGTSGYVEVTRVVYDESIISFNDLMSVFFASHDPTQVNRQGADVGEQYRSVIFTTTEEQLQAARAYIDTINASSTYGAPLATSVEPLTTYYTAESYHQDYFANHPENPYCELVINPKLEKVQKQFAALLSSHATQQGA